jgi:hypothetical protein
LDFIETLGFRINPFSPCFPYHPISLFFSLLHAPFPLLFVMILPELTALFCTQKIKNIKISGKLSPFVNFYLLSITYKTFQKFLPNHFGYLLVTSL